jgi:hypothetical protein
MPSVSQLLAQSGTTFSAYLTAERLEHIKSEPIAFSSHPVSVAPSGDLITFRLLTRRSKTVLVVLRVSFARTPSR